MSAEFFANIDQNPLVKQSTLLYKAPNFPTIQLEHFKPAFLYGMKLQMEEIEKICKNPEAATFENTIQALEYSGEVYTTAYTVFSNLGGSDSNDDMMALEDEFAPLASNHSDNIFLNVELWARVRAVYDQWKSDPEAFAQKYDAEDIRLLEITHRDFIMAGADLSEEGKAKMREYNEKISALESKFAQHLMKMEEENYLIVDNVAELAGLGEDEIATAKALAVERGVATEEEQADAATTKYLLNLVNTSRNPALTSLSNRATREKLFKVSTTRGAEGAHNNVDIVYDLLILRAKVAKLLGFKNYSEYELATSMAKTPTAAFRLLTDLLPGVLKSVENEKKLLLEEMAKDATILEQYGGDASKIELKASDWEYWAEKVRASKYNVDPESLKEYLSFNNVFPGFTATMTDLFGVQFSPREDIPTNHADVKCYEILQQDGSSRGLFYGDYFKRKGKQGGAWMTDYQSPKQLPTPQKTVVANVMNIPKSVDATKPTFVPFPDVSTVYHEFGHASHSLFSTSKYASLGSTNVSTDFVEVPSTALEDISLFPVVLERYAKHYKTGEPIDKEQLKRVVQASTFNLGFETYEYLAAAIIDLKWHELSLEELEAVFAEYPTKAAAILAYEDEILKKAGAYLPEIPPRYKTLYFSHSMTSYSSRYYAYIWSEIYAADACRYIALESNYGADVEKFRALGQKWREEVLCRGNTRDVEESYIKFKGASPTPDALLIRRGLMVDPLATE